jgi:tetratricopeptide (TPR) repeat protein
MEASLRPRLHERALVRRPQNGDATQVRNRVPNSVTGSMPSPSHSRARKPPSHRRAEPAREHPAKRRRRSTSEATEELRRLAGRNAGKAVAALQAAADAYQAGREREALRHLRPLLDAYPDSASVRELAGLAHYRLGNYRAAQRELDAFANLTGSTEQHPVLMDASRALGQFRRVEALWHDLGAASPSAGLVTEGRIVMAGALADRGRRDEAIALLEKRAPNNRAKPPEHQLRLWYALADLHERAGNLPRARALFRTVAKADPSFADVAERVASLG